MKCCFCNGEISGYGNNIQPLIRGRNSKCCDTCNRDIIIPLRMMESLSRRENRSPKQKVNLAGEMPTQKRNGV